jgi:hypothetical protein
MDQQGTMADQQGMIRMADQQAVTNESETAKREQFATTTKNAVKITQPSHIRFLTILC